MLSFCNPKTFQAKALQSTQGRPATAPLPRHTFSMDPMADQGDTLSLNDLALESPTTSQHDHPEPLSHRQEHLAAAEVRRLGLNPKFMQQLQRQRLRNEDDIVASLSQETQVLEAVNPLHAREKKSRVQSTTLRAANASQAQNMKAGGFNAPAGKFKSRLNGAAPAFTPLGNHDMGHSHGSQDAEPSVLVFRTVPPWRIDRQHRQNAITDARRSRQGHSTPTIPSYQALSITPLGTRERRVPTSHSPPRTGTPLVSPFRIAPPWRIDKWYRENVKPSYQALPIAPLGTRAPPLLQGTATTAITAGRLPSLTRGLPWVSQQARYSSLQPIPEPPRYSLRSSNQQTTPRDIRPLQKSLHTSRQSPNPRPSPSRAQTPRPAPTPTPQYLLQAEFNPKALIKPKRLLLVLDLNGTLLCRNRQKVSKPRTNLKLFLNYCLKEHSVLVWSSATPPNVTSVCARIFSSEQRQQLLGTWARDTLGLTESEYNDKSQVYKRLERIWDDQNLQETHPNHASGGKWSQANTLLLDDSVAKAKAQPYNLIEIPELTKEAKMETGKDYLGQVVAYVEEARRWNDVSAFAKRKRFKVDQGWAWNWKAGRKAELGEVGVDGVTREDWDKAADSGEMSEDEGGGGVKLNG